MPPDAVLRAPVLSDRERLFVRFFAIVTSGLGVIALAGWLFGVPLLSSFGQASTPMAPSASLFYIFYGLTVFLRTVSLRRNFFEMTVFIHVVGGLVALGLATFSYQGVHFDVEHLGFTMPDKVSAMGDLSVVGHMSLFTALCFLLSSVSYLMYLFASPTRNDWRIYGAFFVSALLLMLSFVLVLAEVFGLPLLYGSVYFSPSLPSSLAFVFLSAALLILTSSQALKTFWKMSQLAAQSSLSLGGVLVVTLGFCVVAATLVYREYAAHYRDVVEKTLSSISELKVDQLRQWRHERLGDARILQNNPVFFKLVEKLLNQSDNREAVQAVRQWLVRYPQVFDYDQASLVDLTGRVIAAAAEYPTAIAPAIVRDLKAAPLLRTARFVDFYRDDRDPRPHLALLVPIVAQQVSARAVAAVVLRIDPEEFLYPLLRSWPMPSQTAESILVRQEGSEVLFLNELKFRKNSALNLRIPLDNKNVPTVMAVVGQTGFVEGADYRQLPTVAFVRAIPDSPWFFVAHMETSEVYSSMPVILWTLFSFLMLLIFMMGAIFFGKRQAEAISAIQESQRVLKESQSVAQIGSYVFDLVTGFWKSSNELDRLFGLDAAFVRNYESWANLLHPDDRAMMETYFNNEVLGKKSAFNRQYRIITRDSGISRWVHGLGRLGFDAKGRPIEMIGTIQDISDYKRTEIELLKQAEAKEVLRLETLRAKERSDFLSEATKLLASTLEHEITFKKVAALAVPQLADVCTVYDSSLRRLAVAHVDPQKLNLLAEMDRRFPLDPRQPSIFQRVMRSGRSERVANMSAGILQGISQSAEHLEMLKQIGVRTALVIPLWHRCKALGVMLVGSTSARQFNEAEQVLAEELALRGAMAMDNAYLYREAQESIRARETILGVVSHDLKNPLAAIHLSAQLLKRLTDKFEDATITSMVQTIFGATEQMKRLIQDLLDLSKIQSRRLSIEKEKLRPELLVSSALDLMKSQALLKGLALSAEVEPDLPELACDKLRILQVFSNLLGNAIKFTEKGGRVKISVTRQGDAVRFSVSDTGSGISEAELPKIFERFWQTEKTKALGAGLGLSIVRGIVEAHGGSVSVESRVGVGSTFSFVLPISVALRLPIEQSAPVANLRVTNADLRADSDPQHKGLGGESPTLNQNQKS